MQELGLLEENKFQFLIGKVKTTYYSEKYDVSFEFQFLIGKVKTAYLK